MVIFSWINIYFPLGINQFLDVEWANLPLKEAVLPMSFVVICTTFMTYFLNGYALTKLTSTEVAVFMYLQPVIGVLFAIFSKSDTLSVTILISTALIFAGVYLTTVRKI